MTTYFADWNLSFQRHFKGHLLGLILITAWECHNSGERGTSHIARGSVPGLKEFLCNNVRVTYYYHWHQLTTLGGHQCPGWLWSGFCLSWYQPCCSALWTLLNFTGTQIICQPIPRPKQYSHFCDNISITRCAADAVLGTERLRETLPPKEVTELNISKLIE